MSTWAKSTARIAWAWTDRNCRRSAGPSGCRIESRAFQDLPDGRGGDGMAEADQLALDASVAQVRDRGRRGLPLRPAARPQASAAAAPTGRPDQQEPGSQAVAGTRMGHRLRTCPRGREARLHHIGREEESSRPGHQLSHLRRRRHRPRLPGPHRRVARQAPAGSRACWRSPLRSRQALSVCSSR
jgi:hypothetical protein